MNSIQIANSTFFQQIADWFATPSLQLFLLIGLAIFAIAVLILTLTRWGSARPILKCVVLSIVAHVLLIGYAYGTRLIFQYPSIVKEESMRIQLTGYEVELEEEMIEVQADVKSVAPWDQFTEEQPLLQVESLQQPEDDSELDLERVLDQNQHPTPDPLTEFQPTNDLDPVLPPIDIQQTTENPGSDFDADPMPNEIPSIEPEQIEFNRQSRQEFVPEDGPLTSDNAADELEPLDFAVDESETIDDMPSELLFDTDRDPGIDSDFETPQAEFNAVDRLLPSNKNTVRDRTNSPGESSKPVESLSKINRPRRLGDGQPIPSLYQLRAIKNQDHAAMRRGGNQNTQQAVQRALRWLASIQKPDGRWDPLETGAGRETKTLGHDRDGAGSNAETGITALAALAFLGAGNSHLEGPYQANVQKALEFLIGQQSVDGSLAGRSKLFARMYCHSMALLALSEALAVTGDQRLTSIVERGVAYSIAAQSRVDGGWRYQPQDRGDMSQFGWQVMALHSAAIGGVNVPDETIERMHGFLDLCTSGKDGGLASYRPGQGPSPTMTAEALVCRFFMQKQIDPETIFEAGQEIMTSTPSRNNINFYYWYYGTMAMYHSGGDDWNRWNGALKQTLLPLQIQSGRNAGSWPPDGPWCGYGGRVYSTAMSALCLEVYYRYLPIYDLAEQR